MKRAFTASTLLVVLTLTISLGCGSGGDLTKAETQRQFGVRMAKMNLWREAMFRFRRAVEIDPSSAMAHNNLAVAYEANGDFDSAAREYREALRLDRSNEYIQKNYSRYVEFTSRGKKRPTKPATAAATTTAPATTVKAPSPVPIDAPPPVVDTSRDEPAPPPPNAIGDR